MSKSFRYTDSEQNINKKAKHKQMEQQRQAKKMLRQGDGE